MPVHSEFICIGGRCGAGRKQISEQFLRRRAGHNPDHVRMKVRRSGRNPLRSI
jgi:hypothetical protein